MQQTEKKLKKELHLERRERAEVHTKQQVCLTAKGNQEASFQR